MTTRTIARGLRGRITAGTTLLAAASLLTACSSTTEDPAARSASPSASGGASSGSAAVDPSVVTVKVMVDDLAESAEGGGKPAEETAVGAATLAMVKALNAGRAAGDVELRVTVGSSAALAAVIAGGGDCSALFPAGTAVPQVVVPSPTDTGTSTLRCYAGKGISALHVRPVVVTSAGLDATPGLVLARGVTAERWAKAVAGTFTAATRRVALVDAPKSFSSDPADVKAGLAELTDAFAASGLKVSTFTLPDVSPDDASYDAAMATVPTKVRRLDPDVVVMPGFSGSPAPFGVLSTQQFDLPLVTAPDAQPILALAQGYRPDRVTLLPGNDDIFTALDATAGRIRRELGATKDGAACLAAIDRSGQRAEAASLVALTEQCEALMLIRKVATAAPGAAGAPATFTAAFGSVGSFTLPRGDRLAFAAGARTGLTEMTEQIGDAACQCMTPTRRAPVPVP